MGKNETRAQANCEAPLKAEGTHVRATRDDWLAAARNVLVNEGVGNVKVLSLSQRLDVSRSSFYWYFKDRRQLLQELIDDWEKRNTRTIIAHCGAPADTIAQSVCNFFRCFIDPRLFDRGLDFAVREWARREDTVRLRIDAADGARLSAVSAMFERHGYPPYEADVRARVLYFMQLGYHALDVREPMSEKMARLEGYLLSFTGSEPEPDTVENFRTFVRKIGNGKS